MSPNLETVCTNGMAEVFGIYKTRRNTWIILWQCGNMYKFFQIAEIPVAVADSVGPQHSENIHVNGRVMVLWNS